MSSGSAQLNVHSFYVFDILGAVLGICSLSSILGHLEDCELPLNFTSVLVIKGTHAGQGISGKFKHVT